MMSILLCLLIWFWIWTSLGWLKLFQVEL